MKKHVLLLEIEFFKNQTLGTPCNVSTGPGFYPVSNLRGVYYISSIMGHREESKVLTLTSASLFFEGVKLRYVKSTEE